MAKAKLLVVNLQDPTKTKYMSPKQISTFLWGRRISNYPILKVQDGVTDQIVITNGDNGSYDCFLIEKQLIDALRPTTTQENN